MLFLLSYYLKYSDKTVPLKIEIMDYTSSQLDYFSQLVKIIKSWYRRVSVCSWVLLKWTLLIRYHEDVNPIEFTFEVNDSMSVFLDMQHCFYVNCCGLRKLRFFIILFPVSISYNCNFYITSLWKCAWMHLIILWNTTVIAKLSEYID
jgi:hypothetical protein